MRLGFCCTERVAHQMGKALHHLVLCRTAVRELQHVRIGIITN